MDTNIQAHTNTKLDSEFWRDTIVRWSLICVGVLLVIVWTWAVIKFYYIPDKLILHTDSNKLVDVIGSSWNIFGMLGVWTLCVLVNIGIAKIIYKKVTYLSRALLIGSISLVCVALLYVFLLSFLNI